MAKQFWEVLYAEQSFASSKKAKKIMTGHQQETSSQLFLLFKKAISSLCHFVILPFFVLNMPHQEGQEIMGFGCREMQRGE